MTLYGVPAPHIEPTLNTTGVPHMTTIVLETRSICGIQDGSFWSVVWPPIAVWCDVLSSASYPVSDFLLASLKSTTLSVRGDIQPRWRIVCLRRISINRSWLGTHDTRVLPFHFELIPPERGGRGRRSSRVRTWSQVLMH